MKNRHYTEVEKAAIRRHNAEVDKSLAKFDESFLLIVILPIAILIAIALICSILKV